MPAVNFHLNNLCQKNGLNFPRNESQLHNHSILLKTRTFPITKIRLIRFVNKKKTNDPRLTRSESITVNHFWAIKQAVSFQTEYTKGEVMNMKKSELQEVYREIKRNKHRRRQSTEQRANQGCNSCGRVTWKPY